MRPCKCERPECRLCELFHTREDYRQLWEPVYSHPGDFGDTIYALPTIAALGGGELVLYPSDTTRVIMTEEHAELIAPLLRCQPYLAGVSFESKPRGANLDKWREGYDGRKNLAYAVADKFGVARPSKPWLTVEPKQVARVVLHRSPRYPGFFPWRKVLDKYKGECVFVGLPVEHGNFCREFGQVPYYPTKDLLELACVIAGAELFVGNQSSPMAIALGLGKRVVQEIWEPGANCRFDRPGEFYGEDYHVYLPYLGSRHGELIKQVKDRTCITPDRLEVLAHFASETKDLPGVNVEVGCWRGGSSMLISLAAPDKLLHVYDTFAGLPEAEGHHAAGDFFASEEDVRAYLSGRKVEIHPGVFQRMPHGPGFSVSLLHIDCDCYAGCAAALGTFWPMVCRGGAAVIDDVHWAATPGIDRALEESGLMPFVELHAAQQGVLRK